MRTAKACRHTTNDYIYITEDIGWIGREEGDGGDLERGQINVFIGNFVINFDVGTSIFKLIW